MLTLLPLLPQLACKSWSLKSCCLTRVIGLSFGLAYAIFFVKETRPPQPQPPRRRRVTCSERVSFCNCSTSMLLGQLSTTLLHDLQTKEILLKYVWTPLRDFSLCLTTPRRGFRRMYLYVELCLYIVYIFSSMYGVQTYLYMNKVGFMHARRQPY